MKVKNIKQITREIVMISFTILLTIFLNACTSNKLNETNKLNENGHVKSEYIPEILVGTWTETGDEHDYYDIYTDDFKLFFGIYGGEYRYENSWSIDNDSIIIYDVDGSVRDTRYLILDDNGAYRYTSKNGLGEDVISDALKTSDSTDLPVLSTPTPKPGSYEPDIGMTQEQVLNSKWGEPKDINKTKTASGTSEQWVYPLNRYVYFDNGIVTAIQE